MKWSTSAASSSSSGISPEAFSVESRAVIFQYCCAKVSPSYSACCVTTYADSPFFRCEPGSVRSNPSGAPTRSPYPEPESSDDESSEEVSSSAAEDSEESEESDEDESEESSSSEEHDASARGGNCDPGHQDVSLLSACEISHAVKLSFARGPREHDREISPPGRCQGAPSGRCQGTVRGRECPRSHGRRARRPSGRSPTSPGGRGTRPRCPPGRRRIR